MQAFIIESTPQRAARSACDPHVVKILSETTQVLASAADALGAWRRPMPRPTHIHHPVVTWARTSVLASHWLYAYGVALCDEYRHRYGRAHAYEPLYFDRRLWRGLLNGLSAHHYFPYAGHFAVAMPDEYRTEVRSQSKQASAGVAVRAYRRFYATAKAPLLRYTARKPPQWLVHLLDKYDMPPAQYRETVDDDWCDYTRAACE